ncbi:hypothetical protein K474DRAFT_312752 [Panus rudis PR-1116 ss-1]|nr:hypothetical protein K474DRAFT_312752 [Panus rudis PR-1116 ss-1]
MLASPPPLVGLDRCRLLEVEHLSSFEIANFLSRYHSGGDPSLLLQILPLDIIPSLRPMRVIDEVIVVCSAFEDVPTDDTSATWQVQWYGTRSIGTDGQTSLATTIILQDVVMANPGLNFAAEILRDTGTILSNSPVKGLDIETETSRISLEDWHYVLTKLPRLEDLAVSGVRRSNSPCMNNCQSVLSLLHALHPDAASAIAHSLKQLEIFDVAVDVPMLDELEVVLVSRARAGIPLQNIHIKACHEFPASKVDQLIRQGRAVGCSVTVQLMSTAIS